LSNVLNFVHDTLVISLKSGFYNHPFSMTISNTFPGIRFIIQQRGRTRWQVV
jgi:hypothetical protein